jgi:glutaredoxin 3
MKDITLYTTDYCPYCTAAKALFKAKNLPYQEINVSGDSEKRRWLVEKTGQMTVPQIFIGELSVGGFDDVNALNAQGQLDALLAD